MSLNNTNLYPQSAVRPGEFNNNNNSMIDGIRSAFEQMKNANQRDKQMMFFKLMGLMKKAKGGK